MFIELIMLIPLGLLLWALYPLPYMLYYKLIYGKNVEIEYFPFIGRMAWSMIAFKKYGDNCYYRKHARDNKPNLDINLSNDPVYGHMFMIYSPELAKQFAQNMHNYKSVVLDFMEILSTEGIFFSDGHKWLKQRTFLGKTFNFNLIQKAQGLVERICQAEMKDLDKPQEYTNIWASIAGQAIQELFMGERNLNFKDKPLCLEIRRLIQRFLSIERLVWIKGIIRRRYFKKRYPSWLIYDEEKEDERNILKCIDILNDVINKKKIQRNFGSDTLSLYIEEQEKDPEITDTQITHQFLSLIFAGMDTTSTLTQNCCYVLGKYQDVQEKVRQALINNNNDDYVTGFINETLRFYNPIAGLFVKEAVNSHYLGPYWIPKGKSINVQFYANLFDKRYFPDPHRFWPERWFTEGGKDFSEASFAFIPFWAGKRNCQGQHLAQMEIRIILKNVLQSYQVTLKKEVGFTQVFLYGMAETVDVLKFTKLNK